MNTIKWLAAGPHNPGILARLKLTHDVISLATGEKGLPERDGLLLLPNWESDNMARYVVSKALAHNLPIKAVCTITDQQGALHDVTVLDTDDATLWQIVRGSAT